MSVCKQKATKCENRAKHPKMWENNEVRYEIGKAENRMKQQGQEKAFNTQCNTQTQHTAGKHLKTLRTIAKQLQEH